MDDLISRKEVIQWVKAECNPYGKPTIDFESGKKVIEHIKLMPSVQSEIIRCKDCKHRDMENGLCEGRGWPMQLVTDDGFCDKGERSEE